MGLSEKLGKQFSPYIAESSPKRVVTCSPEYTLNVGTPDVIEFKSQYGKLSAVFEDDGDTGYFYALDYSFKGRPIQEATHIYNVKNVSDRNIPSRVRIVWSADGRKTCLWINEYPHAVFDFAAQKGYCRTNFPPPGKWKTHDFLWDDSCLGLFE